MDTNTIPFYAIAGILIWSFILIQIIQSGSRSKKIELQQKKQLYLLAKMAEKAGVTLDEVKEIMALKL